jgi:tetratricopeptide (TPR) repeat protein
VSAQDLRSLLARIGETSDLLQRNISVSHNKIGDMLVELGRYEEALKEFRKAYDARANNERAANISADDQRDLSLSHNRLSLALEQLGRTSEALEEIDKSVALREKLAQNTDGSSAANRDLDVVRHRRAALLLKLNRIDESGEALEGILERCLDRSRREPKNIFFLRDMAATYKVLSAVELLRLRQEAALDQLSKGEDSLRQALQCDPRNPTVIEFLASLLISSADILLLSGNLEQAENNCREVRNVLRRSLGTDPRPEDERGLAAGAESILAEIEFRRGKMKEACDGFERSIEIIEKLPNLLTLESQIVEKAFHAYGRLASLLLQDDSKRQETERLIRRAVEIGSHLVVRPACSPWVHGDLAANLQNLGRLLAGSGRQDEAARTWLAAAALVDRDLEARGNDSQWFEGVLDFHWELLRLLSPAEFFSDGRTSKNAAAQRKEIEFAIRLVTVAESASPNPSLLAITLSLLAGLELAVGDCEKALEHLEQSLAHRLDSGRRFADAQVVLDVQRIVALQKRRTKFDAAAKALQDGIELIQRQSSNHNPTLIGLWTTLGSIRQQMADLEGARDAHAHSYDLQLTNRGPQDEKTRESLKTVLQFDTLLGKFERGVILCEQYFDAHSGIKRIVSSLSELARDAAQTMAARLLVFPPERGKEAMQREMLISAQLVLRAHGADEASLEDRLQEFLEQEGAAFIPAGLEIVRFVLKGETN